MNTVRIAAIVILVAGVLGLLFGGFSYNTENTAAKIGPVELKVQEQKRINVPLWAGLAAVAVGGLTLLGTLRK